MRDGGRLAGRTLERLARRLRDERGFGLVEALIAATILVIGLIAVAGLTLGAAAQVRVATRQSDMATAAQVVFETLQREGFVAAASGTDTVSVAGRAYPVAVTVTSLSGRVKEVQATVSGGDPLASRSFTTRLYKPRSLPPAP
jgi:Tfp pilus assembly protein PilV